MLLSDEIKIRCRTPQIGVGPWLFFMSVFLMSSSWNMEIALNGVSAKIQPHGQLSPAKDPLRRQMT
jgi:hypothetical protein